MTRRNTRRRQATNTNRAVGYVRVSTEQQADGGVSLDAQREKITLYARLQDLELVEIVTDAGWSAKSLDRPGLRRVRDMLHSGEVGALVVAKLDRLTRNVCNLGALIEEHFSEEKHSDGAALLSVSEQVDTRTYSGRLVLNLLTSVSQWEREAIADRTKTALRFKASRGEYTGGGAPYGYDVTPDGKLSPVAAEQSTITAARQMRTVGLSLRAVAEELEQAGHVNRLGQRFSAVQVARMVAADRSLPVAA